MARRKYVKENNLVKAINTDSLELQKPLVNEYYDINVHNSNMDKIDKGYKQNKNDISDIKNELSKTENTKYSTENGIKEFECKNGYVDNVVIEGETLVNCKIPGTCIWDGSENRLENVDMQHTLLKANNTYTLFNLSSKVIDINLLTLPSTWESPIACGAKSSTTFVVGNNQQLGAMSGWNVHGWDSTMVNEFNNSIVILEGDHTDKPISYFEGLKSVGQGDKIEVLSYKTNEDISSDINVNWIDGYYIECGLNSNYGNLLPFDGVSYHQEYIPVEPNTRYILYNVNSNVSIYDNAKSMINLQAQSQIAWVSTLSYLNGITFIDTKENIKFIRLTALTNKKADIKIYKNSNYDKKQILTTLRSLPNGVKDTIEKRGNKYVKVQRCGEVVLNGSEDWNQPTWSKSEDWLSRNPNGFAYEVVISTLGKTTNTPIMCDKFNSESIPNSASLSIGYCALQEKYLSFATTAQSTIEQWKSELQTNPVTVVYELATPIIEELPNFNPQTFSDKTTLLLNTGVVQGEANFEVTNSLGSELEVLKGKISDLDNVPFNEVYQPTLLNGWTQQTDNYALILVRNNSNNTVNIIGRIKGGITTSGTVICKLPNLCIPKVNQNIMLNYGVSGEVLGVAYVTNGGIFALAKCSNNADVYFNATYYLN